MSKHGLIFLSIVVILLSLSFSSSLSRTAQVSFDSEETAKVISGRPLVVDCRELAPFFNAAQTMRVDVVGMGDSNQGFGGSGWDHGYQKALSDQFGMYATGLLTQNENQGQGNGLGYLYNRISSGPVGNYNGAPAFYDAFLNVGSTSTPLLPHGYMFVPSGQQVSSFALQGLSLQPGIPLNISGPLRFHLNYGTFSTSGFFRPTIRMDASPYSTLVQSPIIVSTFSSQPDGLVDYKLDLPAASRTYPVGFRYTTAGEANLSGPFFGLYLRAENLDKTQGTSFSTLHYGGGYSARDYAAALQSADPKYLDEYFRQVRRLQGDEKHVLIRINSGLNDRNEGLASVRSGITPGNSAEAFGDNVQFVIDSIRAVWIRNGWDVSELYFAVVVSHDVPDSADSASQLDQYRIVAARVARENERTAAVNFDLIVPAAYMQSHGFYASLVDFNHLQQSGYEYLASKELEAEIAC